MCYIESPYINIILKQNKLVEHIRSTLIAPCEKFKMVSFASSMMKSIAVLEFGSRCRFSVELICFIALRSTYRTCCLLKSIAMILQYFLKQG